MGELSQLTVVITRPRAQAEAWQEQLRALGADTQLLPVLAIEAVSDAAGRAAIKARILSWAEYHKVIFVSQNAVQHAMDWVDQYWPQLPVGLQYFAVGSATAASARLWGLEVEAAGEAMNSEALLALPALKTVTNEKVLICRGCGGRSHLGEQLRRRGAQVDYCELYNRKLPAEAGAQLRQLAPQWEQLAAAGGLAISVHSGESLQNLSHLIDDEAAPGQARAIRERAILLVPGERVAEQARQLGFRRLAVAENATDAAMTRALRTAL